MKGLVGIANLVDEARDLDTRGHGSRRPGHKWFGGLQGGGTLLPPNYIFKFADDTTVVGRISNNETEYRKE